MEIRTILRTEKTKQKEKEWYCKKIKDPEYAKARKAKYKKLYLENRDEWLARDKQYYENHKEKRRKASIKYNRTPLGIYSILKTRCKKNNVNLLITKKQFVEWWNKQKQKCFYCKRNFEEIKNDKDLINKRAKRLTIDRLDNTKGYEIGNMVLACYRCNLIKGSYFVPKEMLKIGEIIYAKSQKNTFN